eukprot:2010152-Alexandrium_andersonii.AAC.1
MCEKLSKAAWSRFKLLQDMEAMSILSSCSPLGAALEVVLVSLPVPSVVKAAGKPAKQSTK